MSINISRRSFIAGLGLVSTSFITGCNQKADTDTQGTAVEAVSFTSLAESDGGYAYDALEDGHKSRFCDVLTPAYYIFAGNLDLDGANDVVSRLGLANNLYDWAGSVHVIVPSEENGYTDADADAFVELVAAVGPVNNVKVIGIDEGATFVAGSLASKLYFVAGVMLYGGETPETVGTPSFVPAYLSGVSEEVVSEFVEANSAVDEGDGLYVNPDNELKRVVVGNDSDLAGAFAAAWDSVFCKNYRQHNEQTEFYMASPAVQTEPYLLYGIPDYSVVEYVENYNEPVAGDGSYTWFEYVPEFVKDADNGTVPLIVTLHGNLNDTRCQGDTTGWVELAVEEGLIVVAPEWQDVVYESMSDEPLPNFFECDGLQDDMLITWLGEIEEKYPQIDKSRIYITGLSAGASASELYALRYNDVFAAVGAISGPGIDKAEISELAETYDGPSIPLAYICGDHDFFGMIPVDLSSPYAFPVDDGVTIAQVDPNVDIFPVIQSFQKVNGLEVSEAADLSLDEYYGIQFDETNSITMGEKEAIEGILSNSDGIIMKFVTIKDQAHWNYKPQAAYLWEFFKGFTR